METLTSTMKQQLFFEAPFYLLPPIPGEGGIGRPAR